MTRVLAMLLSCAIGVGIGLALATRPRTPVATRSADVVRLGDSSAGDVAPGAAPSGAAVATRVGTMSAAASRDEAAGIPPDLARPASGGSQGTRTGRSRIERAGSALLDALSAGPSERSSASPEESSPPLDEEATQAIARDDARVAVAAMLQGFDAALPHGPNGAHEPSPPPLLEGDE